LHAEAVAVLLPPALLPAFLGQCAANPSLACRVRGVLLEPGPPPDYSDAEAAPLAAFALYGNASYAWNPAGGCRLLACRAFLKRRIDLVCGCSLVDLLDNRALV
jgi:hypothetical protein